MRQATVIAVLSLVYTRTVSAVWPFQAKSNTVDGFVNAGTLGLGNVTGRVVAFGDWNGDQKYATIFRDLYDV
jgi:integrin alpha FG-GAP repeat containing protein 1